MGLFDKVTDAFDSVKDVAVPVGVLGGATLLGGAAALPGAVTLLGGLLGQQSIDEAELIARGYTKEQIALIKQAQEQQLGLIRETTDKQIAANREATERAMRFLEGMYADTAPARGVYSSMATTSPTTLRPSQELALEDLQRQIAHRLSAAGTRGTGRGGIELGFDALRRGRLGMEEANRAEQREAARTLTMLGFRVPTEQAGLVSSAGAREAGIIGAGGSTAADVLGRGALTESGLLGQEGATRTAAEVAKGQQFGDALGAIAGLISGMRRDQDPSRRYQGLLEGWF